MAPRFRSDGRRIHAIRHRGSSSQRAPTSRSTECRGRKPLNVFHVATINKPIAPRMGYAPIETIIGNIHKGLTSLGHHSTVACSADSIVGPTKYPTVSHSLGDYCREGTAEAQATVALHLSKALARIRQGDVDIVHMHEWWGFVCEGRLDPPVPIVMTLHVPASESGLYTHPTRLETTRSGSR